MYECVKSFFTDLGYTAFAEVKNCDIVLLKNDTITIIEMKTSFNLKLLYQALDRLKISKDVYVCIPRPTKITKTNYKNMITIVKKLGLGLIIVAIDSPVHSVDILCLPASTVTEKSVKSNRKKSVLKEISGRTKDINTAGTLRAKLHTAYREKNIKIACIMEKSGGISAKELVNKYLCKKDAYSIIYKNFYGWFERIDKGIYSLSNVGKAFLNGLEFKELIEYYRNKYKEIPK